MRDVRVLGAIGVVQLDRPVDVAGGDRAAVRRGVWLRPFRDLIYTMPPYVTRRRRRCRDHDAVVAVASAAARHDSEPSSDLRTIPAGARR